MNRSLPVFAAALVLAAAASVAFAGDDVTSLSYISYAERYATVQPAQTSDALDAVVNMPVLTGDRLTTSRGARVEVQLADGSTVWVDEFSTLDFDALAYSRDDSSPRSALYLAEGTVAVEIPATALGDGTMRLDSPAGTVYLDRPGLFRLDLDGNEIRVQAFTGLAELPVGVGSALLRGGEEATVGPGGDVQKAGITDRTDDFWNWVQERRTPSPGPTAQYVTGQATDHAAALNAYGDWVYVDTFSSWMWRPHVSLTWVPYSYGRWYWTPVGYSWISYYPWGWYPFHYGSWYFDASFGWVWGWDSVWSPAWVHWIYTPGYVGWCPRGYYDWWYYHNCSHCWGDTWMHPPSRWSEAAFDFSGRVRMGQVDPRPWTIVPEGQFANTHLDRVRLDPSRFLRDGPSDRTGVVRTGPLVTSAPPRGYAGRGIESFFGLGTVQRDVPDITQVLGRENIPGTRAANAGSLLRPTLTRDVSPGPRVPSTRGGVEPGLGDLFVGRATPRTVGNESSTGSTRERPSVQRSRAGSGSSIQAPTERRPAERPTAQDTRGGQPGEAVRAPSRNVNSGRSAAPTPERPQTPPAADRSKAPGERPPLQSRARSEGESGWLSRTRERLWNRAEGERQAATARSAGSRTTRETQARSQAWEERYQPRGVVAPQTMGSREPFRVVPVSRQPIAGAPFGSSARVGTVVSAAPHVTASSHVAPSRAAVPHAPASRTSVSSGRPH
jgi:hypothetical protein